MDLRNNTIFGWVLGAGILALGLGVVSGKYFSPGEHGMEHPGYVVVGEAPAGAAAGPSLNTLLASADPAAGAQVFKKCTACHTDAQGGANGIGPNLFGVVGESVGQGHGGFAFSDALKSKGGKWDFATLDEWFKSPAKFAPGTKMSFAGLGDGKDRANLIAYLNTLGVNLPLPAADAPADAAAAPGAEGAAAPEADKKDGAAPADAKAGDKPAVAAPKAAPAAEPAKK